MSATSMYYRSSTSDNTYRNKTSFIKTKKIVKMKKITILALLCLMLFNAKIMFAQESSVIKIPVTLSQGYVLLQPSMDIDYWTIEILIRTYSDSINYIDNSVEKIELIGDNYYTIPNGYVENNNAFIKVTQHKSNGNENVEIQKLNDIPQEQYGYGSVNLGSIGCNGSTYAWEVRQTGRTYFGNVISSTFSLCNAVESVDQNTGVPTPYYQYFTPDNFFALRDQLTDMNNINYNPYINGTFYKAYYQVGNALVKGTINNAPPFGIVSIVRLQYDPLHRKKDKTGVYISGVPYVYGIAKGEGVWGDCVMASLPTTYTYSQTSLGIQWVMNLMNNDSQASPSNCGKPNLSCSSAGGSGPKIPNSSWSVVDPKNYIVEILRDSSLHTNWDVFSKVNKLFYTDTNDWWQNYYAISLTKISGNQSELMNVKISDFFDGDGNRVYVPLALSKGLYSIGIQFKNGAYTTLLTDKKNNDEQSTSDLSSFLSVNIFPVPILENEFSIAFSATKDLEFVYKLYDFNMTLLYKVPIQIRSGEVSTIIVSPENQIPDGMLINSFEFVDGSQSSVVTVK